MIPDPARHDRMVETMLKLHVKDRTRTAAGSGRVTSGRDTVVALDMRLLNVRF